MPSVSIENYGQTTVELDYVHGTGALPTDRLDNDSPDKATRALHAIAVATDGCIVKKGFDAISATVNWVPFAPVEDRTLGRWSVDYASRYGAERSPDDGPAGVDLVKYGVDFNKAYANCQDAAKESLRPELEFMQSRNMISEIRSRAFTLAVSSVAGQRAIAAWRKCSEDAGIVLDPRDGFPVEEYKAQGKEAEIKAYVTHARCARSTSAIQEVFDLRARYELALIDSQQAKINTFENEQRKVMDVFDKVIAGG